MMEVPLIMLAAGVVLAVALPRVPPGWGKVLMIAGTLIWIGGLYYMIVIPGWLPDQSRMRLAWRWMLFLVFAAALIFIAGAYVIAVGPAPA